jgi:hypothetical protein
MTRTIHFVGALLVTALVCSAAGAQMRGRGSSMRMPSVRVAPSSRVSTALPRAFQQVRLIQITPAGPATSALPSFTNSASFGRGFRNNTSSGNRRGARSAPAVFVPILYGGYPYYYGDSYSDSSDSGQSQQQPQVITDQQPLPAAQQYADSGVGPGVYLASPPAAPVRDVGEFVLVRRDGQILFASAFMVGATQLTYVTPEGIRHTLPLAELDADATQQMNEARGSTVQIHN